MMNSALVSILPRALPGSSPRARVKNRKATHLQALEQHHAEGIEGLFTRIIAEIIHSVFLTLEHGDHEHLGEVGGEREQFRGRLVKQIVLGLDQDRADQPRQRGVHRHAMPSLIRPMELLIEARSAESRPAIGASIRMKPMMVPRSPSFMSAVAGKGAELVGSPQRIGEATQQQRLIEPVMALQAGLEDQIADVVGDVGRAATGLPSPVITFAPATEKPVTPG